MAELELCKDFVEGNARPEAPLLLAKGIKSRKSDLLNVIESLGVYLTSTVTKTRCRATELLSDILCNVCTPSDCVLPLEDVHYLITFYCARLCERTELHPPALKGLHAMVYTQDLGEDVISTVAQTVLREVHVQSMGQPARRMVFEIIQVFLFKYTTVVQRMGSEFVLGVIKAVDGEKDPRNLTIVFSFIPTLAQHFELGALTEDLFEVVACYFPIDFIPPPDDPITQDDLVGGLRKCLTATPSFSQYCIPLLLEKLSSDLQSAKVDSLLTLAAGGHVFGEAGLMPHIEQLWTSVRKEVLHSYNKAIQSAALEAMKSITMAICSPLNPRPSQFITLCVRDLKRNIVESELKLMVPSCQILLAVAMAADPACVLVVREVVPLLVQRVSQSQLAQKKVLLEMLANFASVAYQFTTSEVPSPLEPFKDLLLHTVLSVLGVDQLELKQLALHLAKCVLPMLSEHDLQSYVQPLYNLAAESTDNQLRTEARNVLVPVMQRLDPNVVTAVLVTPLLTAVTSHQARDGALSLLAAVCHQQEVFVTVVTTLLATLEKPQSPTVYLCNAVRVMVEEFCEDPAYHPLLCNVVVPKLLQLTICATPLLVGEEVINQVAIIVRTVTRTVDSRFSRALVNMIVTLLTSSGLHFAPLEVSSPLDQTQLVAILSASLSSIRPQDVDMVPKLLPQLCQLACLCSHAPSALHAAHCYSSCLNKMADGEELEEALRRDVASAWTCVQSADTVVATNTTSLLTWVSKALIMRGHVCGEDMVFKIFRYGLENEQMSTKVVEGMKVLFSDQTTLLNEQSHAQCKLFYKQRLFERLLPNVVGAFKEERPGSRDYCLLVLSHLLQSVPQQVVSEELASVLPLLLASLDCKDTALSAVQALDSLTKERPSLLCHHITSVLTPLMKLTTPPNPLKLRALALHCIGLVSTLPSHQVYPYRTMVVQGITGCLDDHKRIVRKEAINSRLLWLQLGSI